MSYKSFFPLTIATTVLIGGGCATKVPTPAAPVTPPASESSISPEHVNTKKSPLATLAFPGILPATEVNKKVRIKTTLGDMVIKLDANAGPRAASNFVYLVGKGFYNGTIFHRVIPGFMVQGGDPTGTGMGGPGYRFDNDEVKNLPSKTITVQGSQLNSPVYEDGIVAMANAGPNTNGSQFFIMVADYPLPPAYSIFGKVVEGLDVAHKMAQGERDESDRPRSEIKMLEVRVEE